MYQTSIRNKKKRSLFNHEKESNYNIDPLHEEYAYVDKILGNCRVFIISNTGKEYIGIIRGSLRKFNKRILIERGDIVVISKRDYQIDKVDIVHKINSEQTNNLINDAILSNILINLYTNKKSTLDVDDLEFKLDNIEISNNDSDEEFVNIKSDEDDIDNI